jgi:hypothetical protein
MADKPDTSPPSATQRLRTAPAGPDPWSIHEGDSLTFAATFSRAAAILSRLFAPSDALQWLARAISSAPSRLRRWWEGVETEMPPPAPARTRSVAYDKLVRSQLYADPAGLEGAAARLVPRPFHEAFDHPRSRIDVDTSSFASDLLGRFGLAVAVAVTLAALLIVFLATGLYLPPGESVGTSPLRTSAPSRPAPPSKSIPSPVPGSASTPD